MTHSTTRLGIVLSLAAIGCSSRELPGHYWDVVIEGADNQCTGNAPDYAAEYEYRLVIEGNDIELAIGPDVFALGRIEACTVEYSSLAWSDYRDGNEIQWEILGEGRINLGSGAGCVEGTDWEGVETFVVTYSAHPDVSSGCTYTTNVTGTYTHVVE